MSDPLPVSIRRATAADGPEARRVIGAAFVDEPEVVGLQAALEARPDHVGFVAEHEGRVVGHVGLTRCWIDAPDRVVEALVLSPLSVDPSVQSRGVGRALLDRAIEHGRDVGVPAVFLEGDPGYYSRNGWRPAAEIGVTPPSPRVPVRAFQYVGLPGLDESVRGGMVYADTFWAHDAVGLRGPRLERALGDA